MMRLKVTIVDRGKIPLQRGIAFSGGRMHVRVSLLGRVTREQLKQLEKWSASGTDVEIDECLVQ